LALTLLTVLNARIAYTDDCYTEEGHTIAVNDRIYVMAQGSILMWGETFVRFAEMINHELELQVVPERIYLLTYDDAHYMIFLTEDQRKFICQHVLPENCPLTTSEWETTTIEGIMKSFKL
jgi:hypothetical protein